MPPGDWNFFKHPPVQELLENGGYPALKWGRDRFAPCSLEDLVAQTDLLAKLCASGILSEESANPAKTSPLVTLLHVLLDRPSRLTLATLNYDLVLEKAVMHLPNTRRTFRYGKAAPSTAPPTVEVLKLHGSLNWKEDSCFGLRPHVPAWGEEEGRWLEVERPRFSASGFVQPSLLLPTLFKQEININYQTDPRARHYKTLWEVFAARLSSATALLTVGCSFPDTDRHVRAITTGVKDKLSARCAPPTPRSRPALARQHRQSEEDTEGSPTFQARY